MMNRSTRCRRDDVGHQGVDVYDVQPEAAAQPDYILDGAAGGVGVCLREHALPGRVHERGAGTAHWLHRGQNTGRGICSMLVRKMYCEHIYIFMLWPSEKVSYTDKKS